MGHWSSVAVELNGEGSMVLQETLNQSEENQFCHGWMDFLYDKIPTDIDHFNSK